MFGMIESLAKAAAAVVTVPVAVVADVVTLGGALTDKDQPYAAQSTTTWQESCGKTCTRPVEVSGGRP